MPMHNAGLNALANHLTDRTIKISLHTADPTAAGDNEVATAGTAYARQDVAAAGWSAAAEGDVQNSAAVNFPTATADWGTVTHWGARADFGGGEVFFASASVPTPTAVSPGESWSFAAGDLRFDGAST